LNNGSHIGFHCQQSNKQIIFADEKETEIYIFHCLYQHFSSVAAVDFQFFLLFSKRARIWPLLFTRAGVELARKTQGQMGKCRLQSTMVDRQPNVATIQKEVGNGEPPPLLPLPSDVHPGESANTGHS